jgi:hypothetical protein
LDIWRKFKYYKSRLAGAGIQTAALAFGGFSNTPTQQEQQKNMMERLGQVSSSLATARIALGGAGTQTAGLAFGGIISRNLYSSNRRMDRCRSTNNSYNHSFLTLYLLFN